MSNIATQKKRITLSRAQTIELTDRIRTYSPHIIETRPSLVDFVKTISEDMGCEVSRHAVRETFLVLNKGFKEWPRKNQGGGRPRDHQRRMVAKLAKTVVMLCDHMAIIYKQLGLVDAELHIQKIKSFVATESPATPESEEKLLP